MAKKDDCTEHPLIAKLVPDAGAVPPRLSKYVGYVGKAANGRVRIYSDLELTSYVELDEDAIEHWYEVPESEMPDGATAVLVRPETKVQVVAQYSATTEAGAELLGGSITDANLAAGHGAVVANFTPATKYTPLVSRLLCSRICPPPSLNCSWVACPTRKCTVPPGCPDTREMCTPYCPKTAGCPVTAPPACPNTQECPITYCPPPTDTRVCTGYCPQPPPTKLCTVLCGVREHNVQVQGPAVARQQAEAFTHRHCPITSVLCTGQCPTATIYPTCLPGCPCPDDD